MGSKKRKTRVNDKGQKSGLRVWLISQVKGQECRIRYIYESFPNPDPNVGNSLSISQEESKEKYGSWVLWRDWVCRALMPPKSRRGREGESRANSVPNTPDIAISHPIAASIQDPGVEGGVEGEWSTGVEEVTDIVVASRAHKKSKRGCKTCKVRKIKCDEAHPVCDSCRIYYQGKKQSCEYPPATPTVPITAASSSSGSLRAANQRKKRKGKEKAVEGEEEQSLNRGNEPGARRISGCPLANVIDAQMMDPFRTHPDTPEPEADDLMKHCMQLLLCSLTLFERNSFPITRFCYQISYPFADQYSRADFQTTVYTTFPFYPSPSIDPQAEFYAPLIYTDALLYYVTLQLSAMHLENLSQSTRKLVSKRLMGECLILLRERVERCTVSDETLAGVTGLIGVEHQKGNVRVVQTHMRGLQRMLQLRGGLNAIRRSNGMVANIVFCTFVATNEEPFPTIDLTSPLDKPLWYHEASPLFDSSYYISFTALGVPPDYATILHDNRILAATYQQASDCASVSHYLSVLVYLCASLQRVMSLPPLPVPDINRGQISSSLSPPNPQAYNLTESIRAALILHVFAQWTSLPPPSPTPSLLVANVRQNLKSALKPLMVPGRANELILWFLCVGASGSERGSPERRWFVGHLAAVMEELGVRGFEGLRGILRKVGWHEWQDGGLVRGVVGEVERLG
ncbi:hypothetical protein BCR34DRAFT_84241 [Clohesyomyces aquaticus]|uniref:Zn(2)-C6 fungal-type domain-containing protein n=1 Tax=Clohesyomyces aquaticus TaxID=1231657 RepID=A0A1Y1YW47_9PLEO|nr:hypothetical protein BCR34DRAFT_84241 [Clohesyomyces aquaticus]